MYFKHYILSVAIFLMYNCLFSAIDSTIPIVDSYTPSDVTSFINEFKQAKNLYPRDIPIDIVHKFYSLIGPIELLNVIEEQQCHIKGHNVGKVVFMNMNGPDRTQQLLESIKLCKNRCTGACFHGALLQYFHNITSGREHSVNSSVIRPFFSSLCDGDGVLATEIIKFYGRGDCFHSLGHVVMSLSKHDVIRAMEVCKFLDERLAAYYCATGAYHEYFLVEDKAYNVSSLLAPCDQSNNFPAACYRAVYMHKPTFKSKGYQTMAQICLTMHDSNQRRGCFHGYGFLFAPSVAMRGISMKTLCSVTADRGDQQVCIEAIGGVLSMRLKQGDKDSKSSICGEIEDAEFRTVCLEAGNEKMNKDPALYYSVGAITKGPANHVLYFRVFNAYYVNSIPIDILREYYKLIGPYAMLEVLKVEVRCFDKARAFGKVVFERTGSVEKGLNICRSHCAGGCFYGVVMEHLTELVNGSETIGLQTSGLPSPTAVVVNTPDMRESRLRNRMEELCSEDNDEGRAIRSIYKQGYCPFALGHAAMYVANYNVSESMGICRLLSDKIMAYYCANGAYHEYFIGAKDHPEIATQPASPAEGYTPCANNDFPAACWGPFFVHTSARPNDALSICSALGDGQQRRGCFFGYGSIVFRSVMDGIMTMAAACKLSGPDLGLGTGGQPDFASSRHGPLTPEEQSMCVEGAAGIINSIMRTNLTEQLCISVQDLALHSRCATAGDKKYNKEATLFYQVYTHKNR